MPAAWDEFTVTELASVPGESRGAAEDLLGLALDLEVKLPGTKAAFRDGIVRASKAEIIARAVAVLDPGEARAAEALVLVLGWAGRLTPGGLRAAVARAVMEVAPEKARKRREQAAKDARVQRWAEDSGNAALMGRELPAAEVLAADQRITAWARELRKAGLDGDMDVLRARAYLDILLDKDSRPRQDAADGQDGSGPQDPHGGPDDPGDGGPGGPGDGGPGPRGPEGPGRPPGTGAVPAGAVPAGFAGRVNLTVPLATLLDLADRPAEIPGIGPVDPDPGANTRDRYQTGASAEPRYPARQRTGPLPPRAGNWCASRPLTRGSNRLKDDRQMRAARVTHHEHLAPPIVTTVVAASFRAPTTPSWACGLAKPLSWPEIGRSSPRSVTGVGTLRSGRCTRNDYERLRDTFGAFMKASTSSGYGNLPWLPR